MKTNISWLYYKNYFEDLDFSKQDSANNTLLLRNKNTRIKQSNLHVIDNPLAVQTIQLAVQYPGLVTGVGINHEANLEGEFKLGIHFDYTYGMPVVYGSSIKGLLRSAFPEELNIKTEKQRRLRIAKTKQIKKYLGKDFEHLNVDFLRDQIFEGKKRSFNSEEKKAKSENISIYKRDIFYDAVIIKANRDQKILDSDAITPHQKQGILKNPIPISFLKIASGVMLEFRFDLKDANIEGIHISADTKQELFKKILLDYGVGAKTNVGYGQFK